MLQFHSPAQYIHFWFLCSFGTQEKLAEERRFPFCRFLSRDREGLELLLTKNFKRKPCIIEPDPCSH